jgi:hypothetical protein
MISYLLYYIFIIDSGYYTLPLILKSKFDENLTLIGTNLDKPEEYVATDGKYLLTVNNFTIIEKYSDNIVTTQGILRILFDQELKIEIYEFLYQKHQEILTKDFTCGLVNDLGITPQFSRTLLISEIITEMESSINASIAKFEN